MLEDSFLINRMKNGDVDAFDIFVRKYYDDIYIYCSRRTYGMNIAEDLTQETFVHFFQALSSYKHMGKLKNYLYTIAGNLIRNKYAEHTEYFVDEFASLYDSNEYIEDTTQQIELHLMITSALSKLPNNLYEVIYLYFFKGLKISEISQQLNIGIPLTKYRLKQGKNFLKKFLEDYHEETK